MYARHQRDYWIFKQTSNTKRCCWRSELCGDVFLLRKKMETSLKEEKLESGGKEGQKASEVGSLKRRACEEA